MTPYSVLPARCGAQESQRASFLSLSLSLFPCRKLGSPYIYAYIPLQETWPTLYIYIYSFAGKFAHFTSFRCFFSFFFFAGELGYNAIPWQETWLILPGYIRQLDKGCYAFHCGYLPLSIKSIKMKPVAAISAFFPLMFYE